MPTIPVPSSALSRLHTIVAVLNAELEHLPTTDAFASPEPSRLQREISARLLKDTLDEFWDSPSSRMVMRHTLFASATQQSLSDEVTARVQAGELHQDFRASLVVTDVPKDISASALHVRLSHTQHVELAGALVMAGAQGLTLLALPGDSIESFTSTDAMFDALAARLNDPSQRARLLRHVRMKHQDAIASVERDNDLFLEPFQAQDWRLEPLDYQIYRHAIERQRLKQLADIDYLFSDDIETGSHHQWVGRLENAIKMPGLLGPETMLDLLEFDLAQSAERALLPHWFKLAGDDQRLRLLGHIKEYDSRRALLTSVLEGAQSPETYACLRLHARLQNDLGYDLDPDQLTVTTRRALPMTGEDYTVSHSLTRLALYGLHDNDEAVGSDFRTRTHLSLQGQSLGFDYPELSADYLSELIKDLNVRETFGAAQRDVYGSATVRQLMAEVMSQQLLTQTYAAELQGHIQPRDLRLFEQLREGALSEDQHPLIAQQVLINGRYVLANAMIVREQNAAGQLQRLILLTPDAPREQMAQPFDNEDQLRHELVRWSAIPELSRFLVDQVAPSFRDKLSVQLQALADKPAPAADFITFLPHASYAHALEGMIASQIDIVLANQNRHTPHWYLRASPRQRQRLLKLEEAATAASQLYAKKTHARVQDFEAFVHQHASQKINLLLSRKTDFVDPNRIIISTPRETLTYTQMLRDGYDDSIGFFNGTADTSATFAGPAGIDLSSLTPEKVARSVRGTWLSDEYVKQIRNGLLAPESEGYTYRRRHSLLITQLQVSAAALRALLQNQISAQQFEWLSTLIDSLHLSDPLSRSRCPVYPLQFRLENPLIASDAPVLGQLVPVIASVAKAVSNVPLPDITRIETVQGCYILAPDDSANPANALIYTPHAPDGLEFRPLDDFRSTLSNRGMADYYKDRCRLKANRTMAFFLADLKNGGASQPPALSARPYANLLDICFNRPLERKIRDIEDTTTGRSDMISQQVWNGFELVATAMTLPFPAASFAVGAMLVMRDSYRAFEAFSEGDRDTASAYILSSLLNSLGAAGDLHSGMKGLGGALRAIKAHDANNAIAHASPGLKHWKTHANLHAIDLQGELYWAAAQDRAGRAPLFRTQGLRPHTLCWSGQFAEQDINGVWRPLQRQAPGRQTNAVNLSLSNLQPITGGHADGITFLNKTPHITLDGQVYQVQYDARMRLWNIVDPQNPFAFFGKQPVRLNEQGQWQRLEPLKLRGGINGAYKPLQETAAGPGNAVGDVSDYELAEHFRPYLFGIVSPDAQAPLALDSIGMSGMFDDLFRAGRNTYTALRRNLYRDAIQWVNKATPKAKPVAPVLPEVASGITLIKAVFAKNHALVISEAPTSIASKQFLIEHMPLLAEQNVEVLYVEHLLSDIHTHKLQKYKAKSTKTRSGSHELKHHLETVNNGALNNHSERHDYYHLIKSAHQHGITVKPLNTSTSYDFAGNELAEAAGDQLASQKMSAFIANKIISDDVASQPQRRWVALLDHRLAQTNATLPGIADLQGALHVRVEDVAHSRPVSISANLDAGADFRIEMPNPRLADIHAASHSTTASTEPDALDHALFVFFERRPPLSVELNLQRNIVMAEPWPTPHAYKGEHGFTLDAQGKWARAAQTQWPTRQGPTSLQLSLADPAYQLPEALHERFHTLAHFKHRGLHPAYFFTDLADSEVRDRFFELRKQLQTDARSIIAAELPVRPVMPSVETDTPPGMFLTQLFEHTRGVVIGESHSALSSKRLIIDNLEGLAARDVKTLYMEHLLTDLHQADLDRFAETGLMSKRLLHDLKNMDKNFHTDPNGVYTFENLVLKAREHGLEVRAIDCAASYFQAGLSDAVLTSRQQMMNFFAARTIRRHQDVVGAHNWIALVGNSHANTFQTLVPGVAELEGGIGIRVMDIASGQARAPMIDPGQRVPVGFGNDTVHLKSDYLVELATPDSVPLMLPASDRLYRPGMFLIDNRDATNPVIKHRSRDRALHVTPVLRNSDGSLYVDRKSWLPVHRQPFDDIESLTQALVAFNLKHVK